MTASQPPETRYRRIMARRRSDETLRALAEMRYAGRGARKPPEQRIWAGN